MPPDSSFSDGENYKRKLQEWLDKHQYTPAGIRMYEKIFGDTFVSVGGKTTTSNFAERLNLRNGMKVLDIGCGIGGSAFHMSREYGVDVYGVDLSSNMINIALENRAQMEPAVMHRVQFYEDDAVTMEYPESFYDVIYSRDTILHISDKSSLFTSFFNSIKSGGRVFITDYCHGDQELGQHFKDYVKGRDYKLTTVKQYGELLEKAGFVKVEAVDGTNLMVEMLQKELDNLSNMKDEFILEFTEEGYHYIEQGWKDKIVRCTAGDQAWGIFSAFKP